jgi:hypothetical protein
MKIKDIFEASKAKRVSGAFAASTRKDPNDVKLKINKPASDTSRASMAAQLARVKHQMAPDVPKPAPEPARPQPAGVDPDELAAWARDFMTKGFGAQAMNHSSAHDTTKLSNLIPRVLPKPVEPEPQQEINWDKENKLKMKEIEKTLSKIDKLVPRAQRQKGGIYPSVQTDIEDLPATRDIKSNKDLDQKLDYFHGVLGRLEKFIADKKALYGKKKVPTYESQYIEQLELMRDQIKEQIDRLGR